MKPKMDNPFEAETKRMKALLTRAADALEWPGQLLGSDFRKLIAELRKAAE